MDYGMNSFYPYNAYKQQYSSMQQGQQLVRVTGLDGAKAYTMPPNSQVALFDGNDDYMYIKVSDGAGFSTIRKFKFEEVTDTPTDSVNNNWVSREEFEQFKREVTDIGKQFVSFAKQPTNKTRNDGNSKSND